MEIIETTKPKSRKDHQCDFCGGKIKAGEIYDSQKNKFDGIIYRWKTHIHCTFLASHFDLYDPWGDGLSGEDFIEGIRLEFYNRFNGSLESDAEMTKKLYEDVKNNEPTKNTTKNSL